VEWNWNQYESKPVWFESAVVIIKIIVLPPVNFCCCIKIQSSCK
jgi:hypothetical protein